MHPKRIRILRTWLLLTACVWCAWLFDWQFALIPCAFFAAGATCCCGGGGGDCFCGEVGESESVTLSGVSSSSCGTCAAEWNVTYVFSSCLAGCGCVEFEAVPFSCGVYGGSVAYNTDISDSRRGFQRGGYQWLSDEDDCGTMDNVVDLFGAPVGDDGTCNFTGSSATT